MSGTEAISCRSPIYLQLREVIRSKIEDGEYSPGLAIPSENELADTYGINRLTVRSAIEALVHEGLLKRVQGKGVYVLGRKIERDLETLGGFTQTMIEKKAVPSTRTIVKAKRPAGEKYSLVFGIGPADSVYYIKRVCFADDEPVSLEEIYIPESVVPKLEGIDLAVFSLYEVYDFYGVKLEQASETLDVTELKQKDARMLGLEGDQVVFLFECVSRDENGRVAEFARTYTRGDKCNFNVTFHK